MSNCPQIRRILTHQGGPTGLAEDSFVTVLTKFEIDFFVVRLFLSMLDHDYRFLVMSSRKHLCFIKYLDD